MLLSRAMHGLTMFLLQFIMNYTLFNLYYIENE